MWPLLVLTKLTHIVIDVGKYWVRAQDFLLDPKNRMRTYQVRLRLRQPGYTQQLDTTVQARTPEQARRLIRAQYNNKNVMVGQPREIKPR